MSDLLSEYNNITPTVPERITYISSAYIYNGYIVHDIQIDGEHDRVIIITGDTVDELTNSLESALEQYELQYNDDYEVWRDKQL